MIRLSDKYGVRRTLHIGPLTIGWPFPLTMALHSAEMLGWRVYGGNRPKSIKWLRCIFKKISDAKYWVLYRCVPRHQYHIVRTDLPPGYHDEDTLILHACMAMLCRYIENLGAVEEIEAFNRNLRNREKDWNALQELDSSQVDRQEEALAIYHWWKRQKPSDETRQDELTMKIYGSNKAGSNAKQLKDQLLSLERKTCDDEQQMLHRLIDIRQSLWT